MDNPLISVIIPVYRAEAYLRKCLDSVLAQTYPKLQIILVDDGSPDQCGAICEEYAAGDDRITVLHQENGGVSAARNAGLDIAVGDWIGWVDSDDWVEPDMYEKLLEAAQCKAADVAVCGVTIHSGNLKNAYGCIPETTWDRQTTMHQHILNQKLHNEIWSKLWKRELYDGIRFPLGVIYEDRVLSWKLYHRAERVAVIPHALYHYRKNPGSITMSRALEQGLCTMRDLRERNSTVLEFYPQEADALLITELLEMKRIWAYAWLDRKTLTAEQKDELNELAAFCRSHWRLLWKNDAYSLPDRMCVLLNLQSRPVFHMSCAVLMKLYQYIKFWMKL